jgi:hypothetical protein
MVGELPAQLAALARMIEAYCALGICHAASPSNRRIPGPPNAGADQLVVVPSREGKDSIILAVLEDGQLFTLSELKDRGARADSLPEEGYRLDARFATTHVLGGFG